MLSIQQVVRLTGVSSRTLRHYDAIGLLPPSRTTAGGARCYDRDALARLQRILLLRDLGLGLPAIGEALEAEADHATALRTHALWLRQERDRIDRQLASVEATVAALENGEGLMGKDMFDGFDHTRHKEEVEQRWGADAYRSSDVWYRGLTAEQRRGFMAEGSAITAGFARARADGLDPAGPVAQELAGRHFAWVTEGWGGRRPSAEAFMGLGHMYVTDERFAANYGGAEGAAFVSAAMDHYATTTLA